MMKKLNENVMIRLIFGLAFSFFMVVIFVIGALTFTEYQPKEEEALGIDGTSKKIPQKKDTISVVTWNIGYGALGDYADFFMDGGTNVTTSSQSQVKENMSEISNEIKKMNPDILFLQETDLDSKRSYHINERNVIQKNLPEMEHSFAYNFNVLHVPYPVNAIGQVKSGILTFSKFHLNSSTRMKLPCPFSYPVRIANLKRCLMVNRIKIKNSKKELVMVNLHLEAYDSGSGKEEQTKVLKQLLEAEQAKGNYVIAGGDFNQTFSNVDTSKYPMLSKDMWKAGKIEVSDFSKSLSFYMDENVPTCRSLDQPLNQTDETKNQYYMIDGFIVSSNVKVKKIKTLDLKFRNSDHNPVYMEVILGNESY